MNLILTFRPFRCVSTACSSGPQLHCLTLQLLCIFLYFSVEMFCLSFCWCFFFIPFLFLFRRPKKKSCSITTSLCFRPLEVINPMTESLSYSPQIATSPRWSRAGTFVWTAKGRKSANLGPSTPACSCRLCTSASSRPSTWPYRSALTWQPNWDSPRLRWASVTQGLMWKIQTLILYNV